MNLLGWCVFGSLTLCIGLPALALAPPKKRIGFAFHLGMVTVLTCLTLQYVER